MRVPREILEVDEIRALEARHGQFFKKTTHYVHIPDSLLESDKGSDPLTVLANGERRMQLELASAVAAMSEKATTIQEGCSLLNVLTSLFVVEPRLAEQLMPRVRKCMRRVVEGKGGLT